jgi:hypothetical protein
MLKRISLAGAGGFGAHAVVHVAFPVADLIGHALIILAVGVSWLASR